MRRIVILSSADFGLGRGLYIAEVMSSLVDEILTITTEPLYTATQYSLSDTYKIEKLREVRLSFPGLKLLTKIYHILMGRLIFYLLISFLYLFILLKLRNIPQIIYVRWPHPFLDVTALIFKKLKGRDGLRIISDITDLWPEAVTYMNKSLIGNLFVRVGLLFNRTIYRRLDAIVTHNHFYKKYIKKNYLLNSEKPPIFIQPHFVNTNKFKPMSKKESIERLGGLLSEELGNMMLLKKIIGYIGLLSKTIGSELLIDLFEIFRNERDILFVIIGEGPYKKQLKEAVERRGIKNVIFLGPYPHDVMPYVIGLFDVALITTFQDPSHPNVRYWLPKKFVEYSACGKPIFYIGHSKVLQTMLDHYHAGLSIPGIYQQNEEAIKKLMRELLSNADLYKINSRKMAEKLFSSSVALKLYIKMINQMS